MGPLRKDGRAGRDADSDGKFHERDGGGGDRRSRRAPPAEPARNSTRATVEDIAEIAGIVGGGLAGGEAANRFAAKAFNSGLTRFGVEKAATATRTARWLVPVMRLGAGGTVAAIAAGPAGVVGAAVMIGGVGAYYGIREWMGRQEQMEKSAIVAGLMKRAEGRS